MVRASNVSRRSGLLRGCERTAAALLVVVAAVVSSAAAACAADDLGLAPGLSCTDDSSENFPITGQHLDDGEVGGGRATVLFFGAAHCWNTNREAERVVAVYPEFRDRVRFVVVDVEHPSAAQRALVTRYFHGSIPTVVVLAPDGTTVYARAGETARERGDTAALAGLLGDAAGR